MWHHLLESHVNAPTLPEILLLDKTAKRPYKADKSTQATPFIPKFGYESRLYPYEGAPYTSILINNDNQ